MPRTRTALSSIARTIAAGGLGLILASANITAQIDEPQLALLSDYETPYRWENVEGRPVWLAGNGPHRLWRRGLHVVDLAPGEFSIVRLPAGAVLRAHKLDDVWHPDELRFYRSNGGGLWVQGRRAFSKDRTSLLHLDDRGLHQARLVRVENPPGRSDAIRMALFVGRHHPLAEIAPERDRFVGPEEGVAIRSPRRTNQGRFWPLAAHQSWTVEVEGPRLLELQSRFRYPTAEARAQQSYFIHATLDDSHEQWIEHFTGVETGRMIADGKDILVGRLRSAYLDVPDGIHTLEIEASASLYVQLLGRHDADFLLPGLNGPGQVWKRRMEIPAWQPQVSGSHTGDDAAPPAHGIQAANDTARNNLHREGGLLGWRLAARKAVQRPDAPRLARYAEEMRAFHTFYRPLLPATETSGSLHYYARFLGRSLENPDDHTDEIFIAEQHLPDAIRKLGAGFFHAVPRSRQNANLYYLPSQSAPSLLRLAVDLDASPVEANLWLQVGDRPPRHIRVATAPAFPGEAFRAPPALGGLAFLDMREPYFPDVTLAGPISRWSTPGPLVNTATVEIELPTAVEAIRLWSDETSAARVAVAYRTSRHFALSETTYLSMTKRVGSRETVARLIHELAVNEGRSPLGRSYEEEVLANHLEPTARLLRSRIRSFGTRVRRPEERGPYAALGVEPARSLAAKAAQYEAEAQPLAAFETWSQVRATNVGDLQRRAFLGQTRTLRSLGESSLLDRLLTASYIFSSDHAIRDTAFDQLLSHAETEERFALRVFEWQRTPTPDNRRTLVLSAVSAGEYETALLLGLTLDSDDRPVLELLRAAYHLNWWHVYDDLTRQLDAPERALWSGRQALKFGRVDDALRQFRQAERDGESVVRAIESGRQIVRRLRDGDRTAVLDWEQWQATHPGPRRWTEAAELVTGFAGSSTLYNTERDLYSRFYRATPKRPLTLRVLGPVRLRLEARPLHRGPDEEPVDDWLFIRKPARLQVEPINANRPISGLRIVGPEPPWKPGGSVVTEFEVEPGLHHIDVHGGTLDLLVRVFVEGPEMPLGVLPALSPETLRAALTRDVDVLPAMDVEDVGQLVEASSSSGSGGQVCTLGLDADESTCFPYRVGRGRALDSRPAKGGTRTTTAASLNAVRADLRLGAEALGCEEFARHRPDLPAAERLLATANLQRQERGCDLMSSIDLRDAPARLRQEVYLARGQVEDALALMEGTTEETRRQQLNLLLFWAETDPGRRSGAVTRGQVLLEQSARSSRVQSSYSRLVRDRVWQVLRSFDRSAGVTRREVDGWVPESPELRVRRALLPDVHARHRAVLGADPLHFYFRNLEPVDVQVELSAHEIAFLPTSRLQVFYQIDDSTPAYATFDHRESPQSFSVTIAPGRHSLRIWNADPVVNQYLLVSTQTSRRAIQPRGIRHDVVDTNRAERTYHVATPEEPLVTRVLGPKVLRVHELDGRRTWVTYHRVAAGWQTLELYPRAGRTESLFRVFESVDTPNRFRARSSYVATEPTSVSPPLARLENEPAAGPLGIVDRLPLGGQEDGTWSHTARVTQPADVDDIPEGGNENDRYLETRATHRRFHDTSRAHTSFSGLVRVRPGGGETLGFEGLYRRELERLPFSYTMEGGTYGQRLESRYGLAGAPAWSAFGRFSLSDYRRLGLRGAHLPRASVFVRHLSFNADEFEDFQGIDQDVFTTYKDNHRAGLRFSDTFYFMPWLDTEWWARGSLATNETLNPFALDHVELRGGWRQLLGPLRVSADYRHRRYSADADRTRSISRRAITFSGAWEPWFTLGNGVELGLWLRRELDTHDTRASFNVTWRRSNGRGYLDYRPRETAFQQRRHLRMHRRTTP